MPRCSEHLGWQSPWALLSFHSDNTCNTGHYQMTAVTDYVLGGQSSYPRHLDHISTLPSWLVSTVTEYSLSTVLGVLSAFLQLFGEPHPRSLFPVSSVLLLMKCVILLLQVPIQSLKKDRLHVQLTGARWWRWSHWWPAPGSSSDMVWVVPLSGVL